MVICHHHSKSYLIYFFLTENSAKGERDISLIKILAFPVAMRFNVHRHEDSFKIMYRPQSDDIELNGFWDRLHFYTSISYQGVHPKAHVIAMHTCLKYCSYLILVLQTAKIVYIDDSYRANTTITTEYSRPKNGISL